MHESNSRPAFESKDVKFQGHVANVVSTIVTLTGGAEVRTVIIANPQPAASARRAARRSSAASSP